MKMNDAPKQNCPDCQEHPPLVYANSEGPAGVGPAGPGEGSPTFHVYKCAMCGQQYRAMSNEELMLTPPNQVVKPPEVECFGCGGLMRVKMVAKGSVPEEALIWQCTQCGTQEKFKHKDIL